MRAVGGVLVDEPRALRCEQAAAAVDQTRGNLIQAGLYPNPQVGYLRTDANKAGQSRSQGVFVGQEFVTAKKRQKAQAVQSAEVDRLSWQYQAQVQRVVNDVRIRYYDVLGAEQSVKMADRLVGIAENGLKTTEKLFEARQASKADVLQARIQLKTVRLTLRESEIRHRTAWKQLTHVVGVPDMPLTAVAGVIDGDIPERDFDASYHELLAGSPQVRAAEVRVSHARAELVSEQAQVVPNVTLQVVAERDQINQFNSVNTFLSVPVPIFNRNQGNIFHAQADIREACQEVERTKLALRDTLADPATRKQLVESGFEPRYGTPAQAQAQIESELPMMRAVASVPPPAPQGTTRVMGRLGKSLAWARARPGPTAASAKADSIQRRRSMLAMCVMRLSPFLGVVHKSRGRLRG